MQYKSFVNHTTFSFDYFNGIKGRLRIWKWNSDSLLKSLLFSLPSNKNQIH